MGATAKFHQNYYYFSYRRTVVLILLWMSKNITNFFNPLTMSQKKSPGIFERIYTTTLQLKKLLSKKFGTGWCDLLLPYLMQSKRKSSSFWILLGEFIKWRSMENARRPLIKFTQKSTQVRSPSFFVWTRWGRTTKSHAIKNSTSSRKPVMYRWGWIHSRVVMPYDHVHN